MELDIDHLRQWIGREEIKRELVTAALVDRFRATFNQPGEAEPGDAAPVMIHLCLAPPTAPTDELGPDGHPARGGFLPPVPLPNRMWAGGRVAFLAPVPIGSRVRKTSSILKVEHKVGRSGDLVFVTVLHELASPEGQPLLREEHDIVYKAATRPTPPTANTETVSAPFSKTFTPTSTTLFRYSALTFNGHRIHYDLDYCRNVEGYANLVIHGPLNATLLAGFAEEIGGRPLREFNYRGLAPALLGETITLAATRDGEHVTLAAILGNGVRSMEAEALLEP